MPASSKGSEHYIQLDRLELLETEVPLFIEQIRGTAPEPSDYGSKYNQQQHLKTSCSNIDRNFRVQPT